VTPVLAAGLFLLLLAFALILFGLYASHIPWLREVTGAAPLERDEDGQL
jgi:hypothetical protein